MQKIEYANVDKISNLCSAAINNQEKAKFERYLKLRIGSTNRFEVRYNQGGADSTGRLFVSTGLQGFSSDARNQVAAEYYHSISFDNSNNDAIKAHLKTRYGATGQNSEPHSSSISAASLANSNQAKSCIIKFSFQLKTMF
jgi:hypothetical protein